MGWPKEVNDKWSALASLIETTLQVHDASWVVYTRRRAEYTLGRARNRNDRTRIMGDPVRYCEVIFQEPVFDEAMMLASGEQYFSAHRFSVDVYYEYADADAQADSSYDDWLTAMESVTSGSEGLMTKLRLTHSLTVGSNEVHLGNPSDDAILNAIIPLSGDGKERAHYTTFTIDVT